MTVIQMPTPKNILADRYRAAYERSEHGRIEWIAAVLDMAAALAEARDQFPNNYEFSIWIAENGLGFHNDHDRAALISMHRNREITEIVLIETARTSLQLIWREEVSPRVASASKMAPSMRSEPESPKSARVAEEFAEPPENIEPPPQPKRKPVTRKHPFYDLERADEVNAIYLHVNTRAAVGKLVKARGGKSIWSLILTAIDAGFLTETKQQLREPNLRLVFSSADPAYCRRFILTDRKNRQQITDRIMPAALANREAVIAAPDQFGRIIDAHWQQQQATTQKALTEQKVTDALRVMPADQREIKMFGATLWPCVTQCGAPYEYEQLCTAIWYFRDFDAWVQGGSSGKNPGARAIIARLSTRWMQEYLDRSCSVEVRGKIKRVYQLVHELARLLEQNPEGECIVPPPPKTEGQW